MIARGLLVLAAGVGDGPVDVPHARHVGTLLAAAEGDGHGAGRDGVASQQLGVLARRVQTELLQDVRDLLVDVLARLGARRQCPDPAPRVVLGQDPADDRPAPVAHAREDDLGRRLGGLARHRLLLAVGKKRRAQRPT